MRFQAKSIGAFAGEAVVLDAVATEPSASPAADSAPHGGGCGRLPIPISPRHDERPHRPARVVAGRDGAEKCVRVMAGSLVKSAGAESRSSAATRTRAPATAQLVDGGAPR